MLWSKEGNSQSGEVKEGWMGVLTDTLGLAGVGRSLPGGERDIPTEVYGWVGWVAGDPGDGVGCVPC